MDIGECCHVTDTMTVKQACHILSRKKLTILTCSNLTRNKYHKQRFLK